MHILFGPENNGLWLLYFIFYVGEFAKLIASKGKKRKRKKKNKQTEQVDRKTSSSWASQHPAEMTGVAQMKEQTRDHVIKSAACKHFAETEASCGVPD